MQLLAINPDRLLAFDRLRELVALAAGNELLLLTPVSALCPLHGPDCTNGQILLTANGLEDWEQHLRRAHAGEPRAEALLARLEYIHAHPYCSLSELAECAARFQLCASDREPTGRHDLLLRPPPTRLHWVPR
jgi:hypothetical protein